MSFADQVETATLAAMDEVTACLNLWDLGEDAQPFAVMGTTANATIEQVRARGSIEGAPRRTAAFRAISLRCLSGAESAGWSSGLAVLPGCREFWDILSQRLRTLEETGAQLCSAGGFRSGEVLRALIDQISGYQGTISEIAGHRPGCPPIVIDYPFGFGDSCEPKIPLWLWAVAGLWVVGKVRG